MVIVVLVILVVLVGLADWWLLRRLARPLGAQGRG
jgi:hypothetical protein